MFSRPRCARIHKLSLAMHATQQTVFGEGTTVAETRLQGTCHTLPAAACRGSNVGQGSA